jgi:acyl carrier protein
MTIAQSKILDDVLALMTQLAGDWEYPGALTPETRLLADLHMESLEMVVLGTSLQERYGRLPFAEYLAEIGRRPVEGRDISVGELVAFISRHTLGTVGGGS